MMGRQVGMTLVMLYKWLSQRAQGSRQAAAAQRSWRTELQQVDVAWAGMEAWIPD